MLKSNIDWNEIFPMLGKEDQERLIESVLDIARPLAVDGFDPLSYLYRSYLIDVVVREDLAQ